MFSVSIIVPVYKVKKEYFDTCLGSLCKQPQNVNEIIIVDDGSPSFSNEDWSRIQQLDNRIRILHKENGGSSSARNLGMKTANGDWITFVDADDWIEDDTIEKLAPLCINNEYDFIMFHGYRDYIDKSIAEPFPYSDRKKFQNELDMDEIQCHFLSVPSKKIQSYSLTSSCCKLYRADFLRSNQLIFDEKLNYMEDAAFSLLVYQKAKRAININLSAYHYRTVESGKSYEFRENADEQERAFLEYLFLFRQDYNKNEEFIKAVRLRMLVSIQMLFFQKYYFISKKMPSRRKYFTECLKQYPYCEALSLVRYSDLNNAFKFKLFCFKHHMFIVLYVVDKIRKIINKTETFD